MIFTSSSLLSSLMASTVRESAAPTSPSALGRWMTRVTPVREDFHGSPSTTAPTLAPSGRSLVGIFSSCFLVCPRA